MRLFSLAAAALAAGLFASPAAAEPLKTVASFSILGDLVKQVGGERVSVETLVGPDGDAHVFSPSPADAKKVAQARIVFENGLGLEGWISKLTKASGGKATVVVATKGVTPIELKDDDDHGHDHGHGSVDPHAWQNVRNVVVYVANIRDALIAADPDGEETYRANAESYTEKLEALDAEIEAAWAKVPGERKRIITSHDAFGYFAMAYGLEVIAPQGVSTESEASAKDVARIIRQIKETKVPAVFVENISDRRLIERIAKETGARVGGALYSDALSPAGGPASTYVDMMRSNLRELTAALSS
ncbi:metal ABC transporter substrate-binding protein [Chenggangzhangella methanolivorans]|uniref:Metal ABC transporter substrate-binding protein n=1 Tax=Chenggangzhangella methanolivorans TaxID=1437009 RepID=A0A9E6RA39_9HYPH|nr:metal ABC transporter substrate-binding protein [Chenggangzhangella methanolivorans]QZO00971.1 metal ABC transporter substrate-binding protein [Chenggangzhangella methanolivorans]